MKLTHAELQTQVCDLLTMTGWRYLHVRKSIGTRSGGRRGYMTTTNIKGWPDLGPCWNPRQPGRFLAIELKAATGLTPEQDKVLADLAASGMETFVVTEADVQDLAAALRRRPLSPDQDG